MSVIDRMPAQLRDELQEILDCIKGEPATRETAARYQMMLQAKLDNWTYNHWIPHQLIAHLTIDFHVCDHCGQSLGEPELRLWFEEK
jgi:hypothetical protein